MRCPQICRRRTPCTQCTPARARRCRCCRTPCTRCAAGRARNLKREAAAAVLYSLQAIRCRTCSQISCRRTPCNHCASSRARKCHFHRLPCTGCGSDRARSTTAAAALLAHAASPLVMTTADAFAAAVLAEVALPPVLGATTLVGLAAAPPVLAEAQSRPRQRRRTRRTRPNTQKHAFSATFSFFFGNRDPIGGAAATNCVVFPAGASVMAPPEVRSTDAAAALQHPDDHAGSPVSRSRARLRGRPYGLRLNCDSTVCSPKCGRAHSRVAVIVLHPPE